MKINITDTPLRSQRLTLAKYLIPFLLLFVFNLQLDAQTDSGSVTAPVITEATELISPSMEFVAVQKADRTIDCKIKMQAKVKGQFYKLPHLKVSISYLSPTGDKILGFAITDATGKTVINVKTDSLIAGADGKVLLKALFAGVKGMESAEAEVSLKRALLTMSPITVDSVNSIQVKLVDLSTGTEMPIAETVVGLFVKRQFSSLKIGEGTTDTNGEVTIEVPKHLPGNDKQELVLIARVDEHENFANLEASVLQTWGTTVSSDNVRAPRALWSTRPPLWMLITFIVLVTVVWGHYIVIVYELIRLRKEEPHPTKNIL
jgi:hypothetical protein